MYLLFYRKSINFIKKKEPSCAVITNFVSGTKMHNRKVVDEDKMMGERTHTKVVDEDKI